MEKDESKIAIENQAAEDQTAQSASADEFAGKAETAGKTSKEDSDASYDALIAAKKAEAIARVDGQIKKQRILSAVLFVEGVAATAAGIALTAVSGKALPGAPVIILGVAIAAAVFFMYLSTMKKLRHIRAEIDKKF